MKNKKHLLRGTMARYVQMLVRDTSCELCGLCSLLHTHFIFQQNSLNMSWNYIETMWCEGYTTQLNLQHWRWLFLMPKTAWLLFPPYFTNPSSRVWLTLYITTSPKYEISFWFMAVCCSVTLTNLASVSGSVIDSYSLTGRFTCSDLGAFHIWTLNLTAGLLTPAQFDVYVCN